VYTGENQSLLQERQRNHKDTLAEALFEQFLVKNQISYRKQKGFLSKTNRRFYIADFYIPKPVKLVIEIDGPYHQNQLKYDSERDRYFREVRHISVLRISNELVEDNQYLESLVKRLNPKLEK